MPSEGLRLGCSSGSTRCVIAKNYVLGQPGGGWRLFVAFVCDACLWGGLWGLLVALLVALLVWRCLWGLLVGRVMGGGRLPLPVASLFGAEKLRFGCGNLGLRAVF